MIFYPLNTYSSINNLRILNKEWSNWRWMIIVLSSSFYFRKFIYRYQNFYYIRNIFLLLYGENKFVQITKYAQ